MVRFRLVRQSVIVCSYDDIGTNAHAEQYLAAQKSKPYLGARDGTPSQRKGSTLVNQAQETAMTSNNQARLRVTALIYLIVNAVVFGACLIPVLMTPTLAQHAFFWIPAIIVTSFALSAPLSWFIAPSMMMRFILADRMH
jgi:hypothetical protein